MRRAIKYFLTGVLILGLTQAFAASLVKYSDFKLNTIQIGKLDGDESANEFSLRFNFNNTGDTIKKWSFGFYMPRSFYSSSLTNKNPRLILEVCRADGSGCTNLRYLKSPDLSLNDWSNGYFSLFTPVTPFSLVENTSYQIRLLHNNQGLPHHISAFPQSLFMINDDYTNEWIPRIYLINSEMTQYNLLDYNYEQQESQINAYLQKNWDSSLKSSESGIKLVPSPVRITNLVGNGFKFPPLLVIHNQFNSDNSIALWFTNLIKADLKLKKIIVDNDNNAIDGIIITNINNPRLINNNPEGYRLTINDNNILIEALTQAGVYYALQTLRVLSFEDGFLKNMQITDYPSSKYRGILLDVARHYFSPNQIKSLIDVMASQKLNTLHIHFSDDEAFRLYIESYPELTNISAYRGLGQSLAPNFLIQNNLDLTNLKSQNYPRANTRYGGFYSAYGISDLINYANLNQITIIPEIDIPGHARSIIKALPNQMYDFNDHSQFVSIQGYTDNVLPICTYNSDISIGREFTQAINTILNQSAQLFNNQTTIYAINNEISVGGDEVDNLGWSNDVSCQGDYAKLSAESKTHLFFNNLADSNADLKFSGWHELVLNSMNQINQYAISPDDISHLWVWQLSKIGLKSAINLANNNYPVVLALADKTYFDLAYTPSMYEPGFAWATNYSDTHQALSAALDLASARQRTTNPQNVLGLEGALWSENLASFDHLMYMALPKMTGLAEASWSDKLSSGGPKINWQDLTYRLGDGKTGFLAYLNTKFNVNYRGFPNGINKELPDSQKISVRY